ncbi:mitochondrial metal transporter [Turnera subulata]|uniref:methionine S-methyltransferase n=1 Tax=Turnera subulata TaxID=218843 RepID=A0A9Q0JM73_9ROSI|nr:mitochondrial metal transporter [Turnera subulata]
MMAAAAALPTVEEFLKRCEESGDAAYGALRSVLERLEDPSTRAEARIFLGQLHNRLPDSDSDECFNKYHFQIQDIFLDQYQYHQGHQDRKKLTMIVIPSIFIPENWSFTFYEGLNRHPDSIFKDKTVSELGCGNGWITIAIAEKWLPSKVYGLDINPRAVKISWINLYLNALDDNGHPIYDAEKKTLLDRVEFHESDLLAYCRDNNIELERIVGCIPQILNPNPDAMSKMITEGASEEFLYSLSNYCALQASDTDISALVEIEKNSPHRFEFFMGLSNDQPICARTAWAYGKAGGRIAHALSVYSCQLRQPNQVKKIFDFLRSGFHDVSSSLDLSFEDDAVADEKIPFLAYLARELKDNSCFPYEPPAGNIQFRNLIAGFMKTYHHIPLSSDNIVVFPSRAVAIENALQLFSPRLAVVDECLTRHLPRQWLTSLAIEGAESDEYSKDSITVIEAPRQSDLMVELIKKLKPQVVVTGIAQYEAVTSSAFAQLLNVTREIGSRLFLDISDHFELSSLPSSTGVLSYLAGTSLPSHAAIICGLVKNKVYSDLEVAFVISEEEAIFKALSKTVEVLEGNTAPIRQYYYGCLFHELLAFQLADRHPPAEREYKKDTSAQLIGFSSAAKSVLNNSELSISDAEKSSLIHMDVDHSFLPIPSPVKAAIFESFARQNMGESEIDVTPSIKSFIRSNYGFQTDNSTEFVYSDNTQALFNRLILCCNQEGGTMCFPGGSNGNYVSAAKFLKANIKIIPTCPDVGFKLTDKVLGKALETVSKPWVYMSGPTINPTGLLYSNKEMENILTTCAQYGARVIIDTSVSGLEFDTSGWDGWDLGATLTKINSCNPSFCVSLFGGLSLTILSGALKFGYLVLDRLLVDAFYSFPALSKPHSTVKYAIKKLLGLMEQKAGELADAVAQQRTNLKSRSRRLKETLEKSGWDVLEPRGGVSMVAKPSAYLNKVVKISHSPKDGKENGAAHEVKLDELNIRGAIVKATGLCINSGSWTGIPGYCRFSMALGESEFEAALNCINEFDAVIRS